VFIAAFGTPRRPTGYTVVEAALPTPGVLLDDEHLRMALAAANSLQNV
jgi:hypothetical protein